MSDAPVIYADFEVTDFKNSNVLSSFTLSATPLTFVPNYPRDNLRVLWTFGDGTTSNAITANHYYQFPGRYTVNLFIIDCYNNVLLSTESKEVIAYDYIPFTMTVEYDKSVYYLQPDGMSLYYSPLLELYSQKEVGIFDVINSTISSPIKVKSYYPIYQPASDIYVDVLSSGSESYWNVEDEPYKHLNNTYSFLESVYNNNLSAFQFLEIENISTNTSKMFARIEDGDIIFCKQEDSGAFFVGLSGEKTVFYRDDTVKDKIGMNFYFDRNNIFIPERADYLNNLYLTLSCSISPNLSSNHLNITTNGLDGDNPDITSFNLPDYLFNYQKIPFVIKIKDYLDYSPKNFPEIEIEDVEVTLLSSGGVIDSSYYNIISLNDTLSSQTHYGSFRGLLSFNDIPNRIDNVTLSATIGINDNQSNSYILSGSTNNFSILFGDEYDFYKNNEDFDFTSTLKDLRFQEFLLDDDVTFDDFFGSIFGGLSSSHDTLGKKIYEKISNFLDNVKNVDRNEIVSLISQMNMVGNESNVFISNLLNAPENIQRLLDMASLSRNNIIGTENKFSQNFDIRGQSSKEKYGRNIGDRIDTSSYVISAGFDLVALEMFSGDYTQLNTYQPVSALSASNYMLSSYSGEWGWPLVLPKDIFTSFSLEELSKYYIFFEYVPGIDGTLYSSNIDFDNPLTTINREDNLSNSFEIMLTDILTKKLTLSS